MEMIWDKEEELFVIVKRFDRINLNEESLVKTINECSEYELKRINKKKSLVDFLLDTLRNGMDFFCLFSLFLFK